MSHTNKSNKIIMQYLFSVYISRIFVAKARENVIFDESHALISIVHSDMYLTNRTYAYRDLKANSHSNRTGIEKKNKQTKTNKQTLTLVRVNCAQKFIKQWRHFLKKKNMKSNQILNKPQYNNNNNKKIGKHHSAVSRKYLSLVAVSSKKKIMTSLPTHALPSSKSTHNHTHAQKWEFCAKLRGQ